LEVAVPGKDFGTGSIAAVVILGSILQNSISAENFSAKFSSSNF
jgi:hypothetical protein